MLTFSCHAATREVVRESVPADSCNTVEKKTQPGNGELTSHQQARRRNHLPQANARGVTRPGCAAFGDNPSSIAQARVLTYGNLSVCACFYGSKPDDRSWVCGAGTLANLEGVCLHAKQASTRHITALQHCSSTALAPAARQLPVRMTSWEQKRCHDWRVPRRTSAKLGC